jgi:solute carrier family 26 (sodium-independent sulfate anion transporter), member 11
VLPEIRAVVLDMTHVAHMDTTGMQALADIRSSLRDWAGEEAQLRFIGLNDELEERFARAQDIFRADRESREPQDGGHVVFNVLQTALDPKREDDGVELALRDGASATEV